MVDRHAALGSRSRTAVLVVVAPGQRRVEVVTGPEVRRRVPDRVSALSVLAMTSAFRGGDLTAGIVDAVRQIADSGIAVLMVEQNVKAGLRIADRGLILVTGRTAYEGDARALQDDPVVAQLYLGRHASTHVDTSREGTSA